MAAATPAPLWINLEYLSAEAYVQRSHGLASPRSSGPARGLTRWFFYPGFSAATGGLLREPGLLEARQRFDAARWLAGQGIHRRAEELLVSAFCYPHAPVELVVNSLAGQPTLLLLTPGAVLQPQHPARDSSPAAPRLQAVPWLSQPEYDHLLWACDLNIVRGEDSPVRALWAGVPFVWQIYPQRDGAHARKLEAFLQLYLQGCDAPLSAAITGLWQAFNGLGTAPTKRPDLAAWRAHAARRSRHWHALPDLVSELLRFVAAKR